MRVQIGFCTSDWWVSRTIRWFTRASASHAYIVFDGIPEVGEELYEAAWSGFRMSTRAKLTSGTTRIVQEIPVPLLPAAALAICRSWLETPYDYLGLLGEAWVQVGKYFGRRWANPFAGPHHMFCSEAATYLLQRSAWVGDHSSNAYHVIAALDARTTDPELLRDVLIGAGRGGDA